MIWKVGVVVSLSLLFFFFLVENMPNHRCFMSREPLKLIWMNAETEMWMSGCHYCKKCKFCNKYFEIMNECEAKELLTFNKEVETWEVMYRGKNKHFKVKPWH